MGHPEFVSLLLNIHASVMLASLAVFYVYSDRTDGFAASLKGTTEVLTELRRRVGRVLEDRLKPIFESPGAVPSPVLRPDGGTYVERVVNPVGSEAYREHIRDFLEEGIVFICDFHALDNARSRWSYWSGVLRNLLLGLFCWQLVECGTLIFDKVSSSIELPSWLLCSFSSITGIGVVACIVSIIFRLVHYRTITELRLKYAEL